ncbi:MAG TPA: hypothetical protein VMI54_20040 [Polyangiaceae bacterium]|nr:hypothetical protein [Polyangiaceae bacterium]
MHRSLLTRPLAAVAAVGVAYGCSDFRKGPLASGESPAAGAGGRGESAGNGGMAGKAGTSAGGRAGTESAGGSMPGGAAGSGAGEAGAAGGGNAGEAGASGTGGEGGAGRDGTGGSGGKGGSSNAGRSAGGAGGHGGTGGGAGSSANGGTAGAGTAGNGAAGKGSVDPSTCNQGGPASVELCGGANDAIDENCDGIKTCTGTTEQAVLIGDQVSDASRTLIRVGPQGDRYVIGEYFPSFNFGGIDLPTGGEQGDIFYAKLDAAGTAASWADGITGLGWQIPQDLLVHAASGHQNELSIAGFFTTDPSETFEIGSTVLESASIGAGYGFLAHFDANGQAIWADQISPQLAYGDFEELGSAFRLAERPDGGIYMWALTDDPLDVTHAGSTAYPAPKSFGDVSGSTYASYFTLLSFSPDGKLEHSLSGAWSQQYIATVDDIVLDASGSTLWVSGTSTAAIDFGDAGKNNVDVGAFVLKVSVESDGTFAADRTINFDGGGPFHLAASKDGSVYATGSVPGTGSYKALLLARLESAGGVDWQVQVGGTNGSSSGAAVAVDPAGYVTVAGTCNGNVDFDPSHAGGEHSTSGDDICIAKYSAAGDLFWSKVYGDASSQGATSVGVDQLGNISLLGSVNGTIDFGKGTLTASGTEIAFAALAP